MFEDALHVILGFTHRQAANGIAIEADIQQFALRSVSQVFIHSALNNAKQRIAIFSIIMGTPGPLRPTNAQFHGFSGRRLIRRVRRAFVEYHYNVGVKDTLDTHRFLRRKKTCIAIHG
jgi:hypothetical protein